MELSALFNPFMTDGPFGDHHRLYFTAETFLVGVLPVQKAQVDICYASRGNKNNKKMSSIQVRP